MSESMKVFWIMFIIGVSCIVLASGIGALMDVLGG